jgi:hypothetical protein
VVELGTKTSIALPPTEIIPGKYFISLKVNIFSNILPPPVSQPSFSLSQPHCPISPPSSQKQGTSLKNILIQVPIIPLASILQPSNHLTQHLHCPNSHLSHHHPCSQLTQHPLKQIHSSPYQHSPFLSPSQQKEISTPSALEPTTTSNQPPSHLTNNPQASYLLITCTCHWTPNPTHHLLGNLFHASTPF